MLLMGIVNLPALFDYWKNDPVYHYTPVVSHISRTRFNEISKYLHFADNQSLSPTRTPEYNKLGKIEPILKHLGERFETVYNLNKEIRIDEARIPLREGQA